MKTLEEAIKTLLNDAFSLQLNINDTFYWACADAEEISGDDALDLIPYIQKYDYHAITAFVAAKRELLHNDNAQPMLMDKRYEKYFGENPQEKRDMYQKARLEIINAIKNPSMEEFTDVAFEYRQIQNEEEEFGEKIKWSSKSLEGMTYVTQIAYLPKMGISGTGSNMEQARKNLKLQYDEMVSRRGQ